MTEAGLPGAFRYPSDRKLRGEVPTHFEAFYRAHLRFYPGARMRTQQVANCYMEWARRSNAPGMSAPEVKRAMFHIGHACLRSNGMHFTDVQLATADPMLMDNFPAAPIRGVVVDLGILSIIGTIDAELSRLRAAIQQGAAQ